MSNLLPEFPQLPPKLADLVLDACLSFSDFLNKGGRSCREKMAAIIRYARMRGRLEGKITPEEGEQMAAVARHFEGQETDVID